MNKLKQQILNWLFYAQEDLLAAENLLDGEIFHSVCFHSQQCVEKIIKAFILKQDDTVPKDHNLNKLKARLKKSTVENLDLVKDEIDYLDKFYIPTRYPDAFPGSLPEGLPNKEDAEKAVEIAGKVFEKGKKILEK